MNQYATLSPHEVRNPEKTEVYDPEWVELQLSAARHWWSKERWLLVAMFADRMDEKTWEWPEDVMEARRKLDEALKPKLEELINSIVQI